MNKSDLIDAIAAKSELTKKDSEEALNAIIESVQAALKEDDKVTLVGFGTFEVRKRAARTGINPQTKEAIAIPETLAPVFKAGKGLKDLVNEADN